MLEKEPIRVAQVVGKVMLAGVDMMVMNYYRNIDRSKIQFDFIMDGYDETPIDAEIKALGGRVYKVEPYAKNILKSMRQYYRIFRENRYPIVHCHMNTLSVFPLFEAWRAGIPIRIAHSHSTAAKGEGIKTVMKDLLRPFAKVFPTAYCACSALAGRWLFGEKFYNSGKVRLMKNAIDVKRFSYNGDTRKRVREKLGITDKFVVGHAGRFVYAKNHDFLIDIFREIRKRNHEAVLLLVGDGPLRPAIQQKVDWLGLSESVMFLGLRRDVPELLQAMDVFVLPSNYEGLGMVAIEAQAAGLPTIVSEEVPNEAQITQLLSYCRLSQPPEEWALKTLSFANWNRRAKMDVEIKNAGFEIQTAVGKLQKFYLRLCQNG